MVAPPTTPTPAPSRTDRQQWLRTLALAPTRALLEAWAAWTPQPDVTVVRGPEAGLVMVTGRIDAGGDRFNLGEATVTRATVQVGGDQLHGTATGTAHILGSDPSHALTVATIDAMLVEGTHRFELLRDVVGPLAADRTDRDHERQQQARGTQVDFFTVSRENS